MKFDEGGLVGLTDEFSAFFDEKPDLSPAPRKKRASFRLAPVTISDDRQLDMEMAKLAARSLAPKTRAVYETDWRQWVQFCTVRGWEPDPPDNVQVGKFLTWLKSQGFSQSKLSRVAAAINKLCNCETSVTSSTEVKKVLGGAARMDSRNDKGQASPLLLDGLRAVIDVINREAAHSGGTDRSRVQSIRNKAAILVGWAAALRVSELSEFLYEDVTVSSTGVTLKIRASKTDQEGEGDQSVVPFVDSPLCAASALVEWLAVRGSEPGALFCNLSKNGVPRLSKALTGNTISTLVKRYAEIGGLNGRYSGHSLRSGFCTQAAIDKVPLHAIMRVTRHRKVQTLMGYIREVADHESSPLHRVLGQDSQPQSPSERWNGEDYAE